MTNNLLINNYIIYNIKFLCHLFVNNEFRVLSFCHLSFVIVRLSWNEIFVPLHYP